VVILTLPVIPLHPHRAVARCHCRSVSTAGAIGEWDPGVSVRLQFFGHSTVLITVDGVRVLTDPVLRNVGPLRRHGPEPHPTTVAADVVVISHAHRDHLDLPSLHALPGRPRILVPSGLAIVLRRAGLHDVSEVDAGERVEVGADVCVLPFPALHDGYRPPLGPRAAALGFVVEGSSVVYIAGDTDLFPEMARLHGTLDAALLPVWGWGPYLGPGHLDPRRAAEAARILGARVTVPIHWGALFPRGFHRVWPHRLVQPPLEFARHVERSGVCW
jgi:L-ascorbate metabolism protein UlaG (beta-lactamase superfamily)